MRRALVLILVLSACVGTVGSDGDDGGAGDGGAGDGGARADGARADDAGANDTGADDAAADDAGADDAGSADAGGDMGTNRAPVWVAVPEFRFVTARAEQRSISALVSDPDGDTLSISVLGTLPSGVSLDAAARELVWTGTGAVGQTNGLQLEARDNNGGVGTSASFSVLIAAPSDRTPVLTKDLTEQNRAGHNGAICWQSVFLLNDGKIASFGTGNHIHNQSNAVGIIDPVSAPGQLSYSEAFPWTQDITPPNVSTGNNLYVSNYDNHPSIYLPVENVAVWRGHGVFDFATSAWTYGNRPPSTRGPSAFLDESASTGIAGAYNPATAYCAALGVGVWFGNSGGGYGAEFDALNLIEKNPPGSTHPYRLTSVDLGPQGVAELSYARNTAVCIGSTLYLAGPTRSGAGWRFYQIDVATRTLTATLTPPIGTGEYFPQMVHDIARNRLVLFGRRVQLYDFAADSWEDVTPSDWAPMRCTNGVYQPTVDAIIFRGDPQTTTAAGFRWHRMVFND